VSDGTGRPHLDLDALFGEVAGTLTIRGAVREVKRMSLADLDLLQGINLREVKDEEWPRVKAVASRQVPGLEPAEVLALPPQYVAAIVLMALSGASEVEAQAPKSAGAAGSSTSAPATPSPSSP